MNLNLNRFVTGMTVQFVLGVGLLALGIPPFLAGAWSVIGYYAILTFQN